jgi:hypothetical protein
MKKLVYARDGKELSRAVIVKQLTVLFERKRANPEPPPAPKRDPNIRHGRR